MFLKLIAGFFVFLFLFAFVNSGTNAKSYNAPAVSPSPSPVANVDSFDLFWPLSAGKTMSSKLYFLKTLKEDVRGMLIFGSFQKADYNVFLSTKRVLEAQALIDSGNLSLGNKTLDVFNNKLTEAKDLYSKGKSQGDVPSATKENISKELTNLETFLKWYSNKNQGDTKSKLDKGLSTVQDFLKSL